MKFITPLETDDTKDNIYFFLAGPIQGAEDWHSEAKGILEKELAKTDIDDRVVVCSPKRLVWNKLKEDEYFGQVDWEQDHLDKSEERGVIIFWLPPEKENIPGRSYAQTTRYELAERAANRNHTDKGKNIVIGIAEGYSGAKYIKYRNQKSKRPAKVFTSLEETCREAVKLALNL